MALLRVQPSQCISLNNSRSDWQQLTLSACSDKGLLGKSVGSAALPASLEDLALSSDERVVGDSVGSAALLMHLIEQLHVELPVASLLTGADQAAVGDHTALTPLPHHLLEHLQTRHMGLSYSVGV